MANKFDPNSSQFALYYNGLPFWSANFGQLMLDNIPIKEKMAVLDVGCGTGFPLLELAERLGSGAELAGIDPWNAATEFLRSKIDFSGYSNINVISGSSEEIPFQDNYFDLIVSNLGLNNFENKEVILRECKRVLATEGKLAITTNYKGHMSEFYEAYRQSLIELKLEQYIDAVHADENRRLSIPEIQSLFVKEGFEASNTVKGSFYLRYPSGTAFLESKFIQMAFMESWKNLLPENDWKKVLNLIENKLNSVSEEETCLKITVPMAYLEFQK